VAEAEIRVGATWVDQSGDDRSRLDSLQHALRAWLRKPLGLVGSLILAFMVLMAIGAPVFQRYDPNATFDEPNPNYDPDSTDFFHTNARDATLLDAKAQPSSKHWLGTDDGGHDTWSRIVWGTRRSLGIGSAALAIAVVVGGFFGIVSGYYSGTLDTLMQRLLDAMQAFPPLLLLILTATAFELNVRNLTLALAVVGIPQISRLVRATALSLRAMPFVEAGRVMGASDMRIMIRHVLPNTAATLIVIFTIGIGTVIVAEASLSFLGLTPPGISWGQMLFAGVSFINVSPWQAVFGGAAITLAVLSFNLVGDALRDILDPRLRI
jgi:peptide/nickel transport system permease protein